jgi:hypothetical protein
MNHRTCKRAHDLTPISTRRATQTPESRCALRIAIVPGLFALVVAAGCASTQISNQQQLVSGKLARPNQVWVYDFAATADGVPAESALASHAYSSSQTDEQIAIGRQLGAEVATQLVQEIQGMGMPAARAGAGTMPQVNDLVIRGYFVSVDQGNAAERLVIGFGSGASDLKSVVEGFQMTPQGLRKLGSGTVDSGGSKGPGASLGVVGLLATGNPAGLIVSTGMKVYGEASGSSTIQGRAKATAKEIGDVLQTRFQRQGWI